MKRKEEVSRLTTDISLRMWYMTGLLSVLFVGILFLLFSQIRFFSNPVELAPPPPDALYRNPGHPTDERVEDLLSRMTLAEKIGQMALVEKNSLIKQEDIATYGIGALLSGGGANPSDNTFTGWSVMVKGFVDTSTQSRLGIPILYGVDANHGHSNLPGATVFPHFIGLGAAGDPELVEAVARATGEEIAATGVSWSFSPTLDLPKDIRWGRVYEAFSDDPARVVLLGAAYVRGLQNSKQNTGDASVGVLATPKHYVGAGGMVWGSSSNKNFYIDQGTTPPDEAILQSVYLPPFKAAIDAGAQSIMVGLNSWGDTKLSADTHLITDVLKKQLGFKGFTVSDWYGVYEIPGSDYDAAVTGINAGIDLVMLPFDYTSFIRNVMRAVSRGEISEERIDDAVRRILRAKFSLGLFDPEKKSIPIPEVVGNETHRALAREAVAASLVLLKNTGSVLPLKQNTKRIYVAGSAADNVGMQSGGWTVEWQGIDGNWLPGATSVLKGIEERAGGIPVEYHKDGDFSSGIRADIGIAVVGEKPYTEGWGDRDEPKLSDSDIAAISKLKAVSNKVIVIIVSGRPLIITDEIASWDAAIAAWLPGSEGEGIADVLFGDKTFRGTLPLPWPQSVTQLPFDVEGHGKDGSPPLFPRYFGLSY